MSLDLLEQRMAWPPADYVVSPPGDGPRVLSELVKQKIEAAIRRELEAGFPFQVGLLFKNPHAKTSEAPIAVVCQFGRPVHDSTLALAHRLAWNFARSPLLITVEPHQVRAWSCCELPEEDADRVREAPAEIKEARLDLQETLNPSQQAAHALHWVRLASCDFYRQFPERFRRDQRADRVLLDELTAVRKRLKAQHLDDDTIHDLLARVVFIKFLFDRKDGDGRAAVNESLLARIHQEGHLNSPHSSLESILHDYDEAYRFFRWLNDKFNGDLFPGKGETAAEREAEWRDEMDRVDAQHLKTLADFVSGQLRGRQRVLWRQYAFDVIPLEFISSIYEEFVTAKGAHYTPGYVVDFMLDEVLSWDGDQWDIRVLDPACGSGIFLVKAYQRLIQRWKNSHPDEKPPTAVLRRMLERNLFGVDIDPHAVRVASFSLYLTMCDEIDPKRYLHNTKFPRLRGQRLIHSDFFEESRIGFSTERDGPSYDLVVGNAPWGDKTETPPAREWADHSERKWPIPNKSVGTLFLVKAASLTKADGRLSMIQPASSLLFNRSGPANRFRTRFFSTFKVEEVVNLSTLRFELFEGATSPPCIVTLRPIEPDGDPLLYISPKQVKPAGGAEVAESNYTVVIEPHDISRIWPHEAAEEPFVWTALAWGGRRDLDLVRRFKKYPSIETYRKQKRLRTCEGVIVQGTSPKRDDSLLNRRILLDETFPPDTLLFLDIRNLPLIDEPCFERSRKRHRDAFDHPQLIIKQGWKVGTRRFQAALTVAEDKMGAICSQRYISVHDPSGDTGILNSAAVAYNSIVSVYFLTLTSGRLASYRPEPLVEEMRDVPIGESSSIDLRSIHSQGEIDEEARRMYGIKDAEWALIEDLFEYTLSDFKGDETSPGRQPTTRKTNGKRAATREPHLGPYCEYFLRVLRAGFGQDVRVSATVFQDTDGARLPLRMVAIHLDWKREHDVMVESIASPELCDLLTELDAKYLQVTESEHGGIFFQRTARVYDEVERSGHRIPTIYVIKPDRIRYWTRSAALRDADEVAADGVTWRRAMEDAQKERNGK